ncbi:MAG TPA: PEGA domain-containing protein, partial [Polyangiaceae bacterium]
IQRGSGAEAAAIELDGVALGESSVGVEVPLDPGPHALVATAPGHANYSETLEVAEEETRTVTIDLKPLPTEAPPDIGGGTPDDSGVKDDGGKKYSFYPYVLMGVGGAALITSGVLFVIRGQDLSELKSKCTKADDSNYTCPPTLDESEKADLRSKADRVKTLDTVAPVMLGIGVVAAGVGGTLFYLDMRNAKKHATETKRIRWMAAAPGADIGGFSVVGQF